MISIKKMITVGAAAGLMLGTAVPAFAGHSGGGQTNFAGIWNKVFAVSNTGGNDVNGEVEDNASTDTGNAETGVAVTNLANKNINVSSCGCRTSQRNTALIGNKVFAVSNTGGNDVNGDVEGSTDTGNASTGVLVTNVVNKNVSVGFGFPE